MQPSDYIRIFVDDYVMEHCKSAVTHLCIHSFLLMGFTQPDVFMHKLYIFRVECLGCSLGVEELQSRLSKQTWRIL